MKWGPGAQAHHAAEDAQKIGIVKSNLKIAGYYPSFTTVINDGNEP